jgi:hypothetical protein
MDHANFGAGTFDGHTVFRESRAKSKGGGAEGKSVQREF